MLRGADSDSCFNLWFVNNASDGDLDDYFA